VSLFVIGFPVNRFPAVSGTGRKEMKTEILAAITRAFNKAFAPYKVQIAPSNQSDAPQTLYAWSVDESIEWLNCALQSDSILITNRYESADQFVAYRPAVTWLN